MYIIIRYSAKKEQVLSITMQYIVEKAKKVAIEREKVEDEVEEIPKPFHGFTENGD